MDAAKLITSTALVGMLARGLWMFALIVRDVKRDSEIK
ncbi:hypothetical protein [Escherichia phage ECA2]|uniref:Uncharacterized protein n=1 Tax=Escherichia phage ECA2 TaxID=1852630 RepID=A0A193GZ21_9CAUD|nr:hypothetical protein HOR17_gp42 [Escherichia phage ECA2]ANN86266.1 hypothetical protein [Escherichia phage ECA2]